MNSERSRRSWLAAMQITTWLPRVALPFAAVSRTEVVEDPVVPESPPLALVREASPVVAAVRPALAPVEKPQERLVPRPERVKTAEPQPQSTAAVEVPPAPRLSPPRFALQLLRAGACLVLVELPTGEGFQGRDPAYLLLRDLLRAAGLPDSPQLVGDGEPIRWPLLRGGNLDQGPDAARDYVQGVIFGEAQQQPPTCLWLVGQAALRFAGEVGEDSYNRELNVEGLGPAWALPGLDLLMDEPQRKAELWQAMRRVMPRWAASA